MKTVGPPYSGNLNVRWDGKGMGGDDDAASEALQLGKPAVTDRPPLQTLTHSFTLDSLIVGHSRRAGDRLKASLARFLQQHLKLEINETKSTVGPTNECTFLGFTFHGTPIYWSQEAFQDVRYRLPQLTGRSWGVSPAYRISKLNEYIRGWLPYYGLSQYYRPLPELDAWLRRRLRSASGNSGDTCGPKCGSCSNWAPPARRRSSPP